MYLYKLSAIKNGAIVDSTEIINDQLISEKRIEHSRKIVKEKYPDCDFVCHVEPISRRKAIKLLKQKIKEQEQKFKESGEDVDTDD